MINLARQNQFNQKILKQQAELLNLNKPDQNATNNVDSTDLFDDQLSFDDKHLMPFFQSPKIDKTEKAESVFSPAEISDLASKNGLDEDEIERLVEHYRIQNNKDHDQPGKMRIGSFLKNHAGFLYSEGLLKQDEELPSKKEIAELLKQYYTSNIGILPVRPGSNAVDMNELYRELIKHINKI